MSRHHVIARVGSELVDQSSSPLLGGALPTLRGKAHEQHTQERRSQERDRDDEIDFQVGHARISLERVSLERGPRKGRAYFAAFISLLLGVSAITSATARAAEPLSYRVHARIDRGAGRVEGQMWAQVRLEEGEDHVRLWLYPDRLAEVPSAMEERSARWIYPGEVDRGAIELTGATVDGRPLALPAPIHRAVGSARGRDVAGAEVSLPIEAGPARVLELALHFVVQVPGRFGRMGHHDGILSLAAPWYPLVIDDDAWAFDVPHELTLSCGDGELLVGDRLLGAGGRVEVRAAYVPALASPRVHQEVRDVRGVRLVLRTFERLQRRPPPERRGPDGLIDLAHVDVAARLEEVAEQVIASARAFGVPVPDELLVWQIPSRTELAATAPGVVLVSDRLFQIFPLEQTLEFHRRALRRALFQHLAEPLAARVDAPADRGWGADLRAVLLVDLDEARRRSGAQTPQELLGLFAFHPAVDQLLYAPQIAFEDAYFATIEERDPFRDDPVRARRPLSSGRRILESARDALSEEALSRFGAMLVNARRSARAALVEAAPERAERLESWLAATGEPVNYRLGDIRSRPHPDGGWEHRIEVFREGSERAEPVEVQVHDASGQRVSAVWDAPGARGVVTLQTPEPFGGAVIDPRHRLPQSPALADGHPRGDDATELEWRPPILNGFLLNAFVTEQLFTGLVDFALRRRYDLEHSIGFRLERTTSFTGGQLRYGYGLGPKVHQNRRIGQIQGGLSFERLHEGFAGELGAWRGQLFVAGGINTVSFALDPREGVWLSARLVGGLAVRDDDSFGGTFRGSVRGGGVLPLGLLNALVLVGGGGFTVGDALPSELQALGGGAVLRGFESDELLGRGALYAVAEHRWTIASDLAWNLAHLVWVRELQLAVFAGAGLVFETPSGEDVAGGAEIGGGIRVHYEYGGVQPGLIAIDVGVPLTRDDARVVQDGMVLRTRAPVGFFVSFDQYF